MTPLPESQALPFFLELAYDFLVLRGSMRDQRSALLHRVRPPELLLMTAFNFSSHGTQDMYPTFLERYWHFSPTTRCAITALSTLGALAGGLAVGLLSDRIGRPKAMIIALAGAVIVVPLWAYSPNLAFLVAGAFLMQFMVQGAWGVIPAQLSELSPDSVRGFLPGFAYQCGGLLASSIVYIQAVFATRMSYATAMALTGTTVFVLAGIIGCPGEREARSGLRAMTLGRAIGMPSLFVVAQELTL